MKIATVCMKTYQDPDKNFETIRGYVEEAHKQGVSLIVFPEGALLGYPSDMRITGEEELKYLHDIAEVCDGPEKGPYLLKLMDLAKANEIYIACGTTERDENFYDIIYNSMVLVGPEGYYGSYAKVMPYDEINVFYPGKEYYVYDTPIGKIGLGVCYDLCFPEAEREMTLMGAEIICLGVQWGATAEDGHPTEETDLSYAYYDFMGKSRAAENGVFLAIGDAIRDNNTIAGHSRIISPEGRILADTGMEEKMVIAECGDIKKGISHARNISFFTLNMMRERHVDAWKHMNSGMHYGEKAADD